MSKLLKALMPEHEVAFDALVAMATLLNEQNQQARLAVVYDVLAERTRQELPVKQGKLPFTCSDPDSDNPIKLAVLTEEVGEVATEVYETRLRLRSETRSAANLRTELIQVAAVAIAWAESIRS